MPAKPQILVNQSVLSDLHNYQQLARKEKGLLIQHINTMLIQYAIEHDALGLNHPWSPTAPVRDPNIEWMKLEIPRCIKTRAQWNCWIGVKKDENLKWKVNGENRQWIIPDEPEGLLDE